MKICEIFASIQGESTLQGFPTVFVRTAGCNLDCVWCDTRYAQKEGEERSLDSVIEVIHSYRLRHVCITGGEPLLQKESFDLAGLLVEQDFVVSVETNGSIDAEELDRRVIRVIDVKCPASGESGKTHRNNISSPRRSDEFKFVIVDRDDFEYACGIVRKYELHSSSTVLFSPAGTILSPAELAEWIVADFPEARLNLQLHKYIWPPNERGR